MVANVVIITITPFNPDIGVKKGQIKTYAPQGMQQMRMPPVTTSCKYIHIIYYFQQNPLSHGSHQF